jgi:four helix bundle protein
MTDEPRIKSYRGLRGWHDSMMLAELSYRLTRDFPKEETFGLSAQIRRAAASIPANVEEGHGRENTQSFIQYLRIAQGSLKEPETHLMLAERVGVVGRNGTNELIRQCDALGKMLRLLIRALQRKTEKR